MSLIRPAIVFLLAFVLLTGLAYPLTVTGAASVLFTDKAQGSIVLRDGAPVGSLLVGQCFEGPSWFSGRPSATLPEPCNGAGSGGSNLGPTNPALRQTVGDRVARHRHSGQGIPVDLVTSSASGLDPDISPAAALFQVDRVAAERGMDPEAVRDLVRREIRPPWLGFLGSAGVNVLVLNLALDDMARPQPQAFSPGRGEP